MNSGPTVSTWLKETNKQTNNPPPPKKKAKPHQDDNQKSQTVHSLHPLHIAEKKKKKKNGIIVLYQETLPGFGYFLEGAGGNSFIKKLKYCLFFPDC